MFTLLPLRRISFSFIVVFVFLLFLLLFPPLRRLHYRPRPTCSSFSPSSSSARATAQTNCQPTTDRRFPWMFKIFLIFPTRGDFNASFSDFSTGKQYSFLSPPCSHVHTVWFFCTIRQEGFDAPSRLPPLSFVSKPKVQTTPLEGKKENYRNGKKSFLSADT